MTRFLWRWALVGLCSYHLLLQLTGILLMADNCNIGDELEAVLRRGAADRWLELFWKEREYDISSFTQTIRF